MRTDPVLAVTGEAMGMPFPVYRNRGGLWATIMMLLMLAKSSLQIDCYVCSSVSQSDLSCEDPFNPITVPPDDHLDAGLNATHLNGSLLHLQRACHVHASRRRTVPPVAATACLKLHGSFSDTGETVMVRACALDHGSPSSDKETTRQKHCGDSLFNDRPWRGCTYTCFTDGCNGMPLD
ncbi:uncharacterized protein LOC129595004 [Paramacrobiotus metropolitanus]|uniref:uncharacterized protein LOC129595004 n=1 Tax=Paramacrobiotus metropolitanus TaxID=2943436 RepID=UPI002445FF07|nr:uncharacterized protein LOC129595004 [Paramacrobiotus metropolitanus]